MTDDTWSVSLQQYLCIHNVVHVKVENIAVYVSLSNTVALTVKKQWMYRHVHTPQISKKVLSTSMGCLYHHSWLLPLNELSCPDKAISVLPYSPWSAHLISTITIHLLCLYIVGLSCTETWNVALWYQSDSSYKWTCVADYVWVEGDLCEVAMELHNPLPFELKVLNMVRTFSVTNVMLHSGDMVWIYVVWWLTCLYCGAFLPTVLFWSFWSCTVSFFSLVTDEENFTSRLFWNKLQRLCHRKLHNMSRHFLNNHICWQKCVPTERWCLATAVPEGTKVSPGSVYVWLPRSLKLLCKYLFLL